MPITREDQLDSEEKREILRKLREVVDPELGVDIVNLGLIYDITFEEGIPKIVMTMTTPMCPVGPLIVMGVENKMKELGYPDVIVEVTFDPPWSVDMMTEEARKKLEVI